MDWRSRTVLVTGASRGLGKALCLKLCEAGAKKVYAASRDTTPIQGFASDQIFPVALDIRDEARIAEVAEQLKDVSILINNAGILRRGELHAVSTGDLNTEYGTNFLGPLALTKALLPNIKEASGAIVNVLSICSLAAMPGLAGYSASKAAFHSATQSLRASLRHNGVTVHGVYPGPINTDMNEGLAIEMASPESVANAIVAEVSAGKEYIFPDPVSESVHEKFLIDPYAIEREFSGYR